MVTRNLFGVWFYFFGGRFGDIMAATFTYGCSCTTFTWGLEFGFVFTGLLYEQVRGLFSKGIAIAIGDRNLKKYIWPHAKIPCINGYHIYIPVKRVKTIGQFGLLQEWVLVGFQPHLSRLVAPEKCKIRIFWRENSNVCHLKMGSLLRATVSSVKSVFARRILNDSPPPPPSPLTMSSAWQWLLLSTSFSFLSEFASLPPNPKWPLLWSYLSWPPMTPLRSISWLNRGLDSFLLPSSIVVSPKTKEFSSAIRVT